MKPLCTDRTAILPPVMAWSKTRENRCAPEDIPEYWKTHDVLTFLADTGMYCTSMEQGLDGQEKTRLMQFRSDYFKKRFVVSRMLLKFMTGHLNGTGKREDIVLVRKNKGILVDGHPDIHISVSYSGPSIALSVAKRKIGTDLEKVRPVDLRKIRSGPFFDHSKSRDKKEETLQALHIWTLVEAYAKLHDTNPFLHLNNTGLLQDARFYSYCAERRSILSLAYDGGNLDHAIFWVDPETFSSGVKKASASLLHPGGDTYVRA